MVRCNKCNEVTGVVKAGIIRDIQRYYCKHCRSTFTLVAPVKPAHQRTEEVSVKSIAKALNISASTVSRALANHPQINQKTKDIVLQTAKEMDYQPNELASALSRKRTFKIGLIVPEISFHFFPQVINAATEVLIKEGFNVFITQTNNHYDLEATTAKQFLFSRVEGLLVSVSSSTSNYDHFTPLLKRNIPIVFFNRVPVDFEADKITIDDYAASVNLTRHLVEQGYTRIAHFAGPQNLLISRERLRGYKDTLLACGLPVDERLIFYHDLLPATTTLYATQLLKQKKRPDAIFAFNDPIAMDVIMIAKKLGISIPHDLGVAGFSDEPMASYMEPSLTTVHHPLRLMGTLAAQRLLQQIENKQLLEPINTVLDTNLIIRNSTLRKNT